MHHIDFMSNQQPNQQIINIYKDDSEEAKLIHKASLEFKNPNQQHMSTLSLKNLIQDFKYGQGRMTHEEIPNFGLAKYKKQEYEQTEL